MPNRFIHVDYRNTHDLGEYFHNRLEMISEPLLTDIKYTVQDKTITNNLSYKIRRERTSYQRCKI